MPYTIDIPVRTHEEFGDSLSKLLDIISVLNKESEGEIIVDFRKARMLNPLFLGGLACAIDRCKESGKIISLNLGDNLTISAYLKTIGFPNGCKLNDPESALSHLEGKTYIPIVNFPTGQSDYHTGVRESITNSITSLLKTQLKLNSTQYTPIVYLIEELTNNINDHSGAENGFVFGQFYPSSNYFDLCISDHGKGIFHSYVGNARFTPNTELEALEFAINGRSTKDRPEARGFGISTSRDMLVNGLRGKFFIWSGNNAYVQSIEKVGLLNVPKDCYFQGTYIALRVPTVIPKDFNIYNYLE